MLPQFQIVFQHKDSLRSYLLRDDDFEQLLSDSEGRASFLTDTLVLIETPLWLAPNWISQQLVSLYMVQVHTSVCNTGILDHSFPFKKCFTPVISSDPNHQNKKGQLFPFQSWWTEWSLMKRLLVFVSTCSTVPILPC